MAIDTTLSRQHVNMLFQACIILSKTGTIHEGEIHGITYVSTGVDRYWRTIGRLLGQLNVDNIQKGATWLDYMFDNEGELWGGPTATTKLIALGMAAGYTHRIPDSILKMENKNHSDYACPAYRTNLQNRHMPSL